MSCEVLRSASGARKKHEHKINTPKLTKIPMGNFIVGLILIAIGFTMLKYSLWYVTNFGRIPWFEQHLHTMGGTFLFYKLLGLLFSFYGILMMTGQAENFTSWALGSFFGPVLPN